jgi:hypothetical protein
MDEGDPMPAATDTRPLVDQFGSLRAEVVESSVDVGHLDRHVVESFPALGDEAPDRTVR